MSPSADNTPPVLPSLPKISSQQILEQVFTHRSLFRRPKRAFEDSPDNLNLDNEQCATCSFSRKNQLKISED